MSGIQHIKNEISLAFQAFIAGQRENILLWIPVFLGVGAALYFGLKTEPSAWAVGGALSGCIFFYAAMFRRYSRYPDSVAGFFALVIAGCMLCCAVGFAVAQIKTEWVKTPMLTHETRPVMVTGTIDTLEEQEGKKGTLIYLEDLAIDRWPADKIPDHIRLTVRTDMRAGSGDRVQVLAKLTPLSPPVAPDAYDFSRHYYFEGIGALGYALSDVTVIQPSERSAFHLENIRTKISGIIKAVVPERQAGIVSALMTGERAAIFDEDWRALRISGLAHIISISGLHVAMVAAPVFFLVRLCLVMIPFIALRWPVKKIAAGAALCVCCLYVGLVVPSVPTTRSLLMTGVALVAIMLDRSPFSLRLVAFSAILVLVFWPESIWSVSFQMSFAAVTALVAVAEASRPLVTRLYRDGGWVTRGALFVAGTILTSVVASVSTAVYSLYHFQQVASYSVLANTLAVPVSGVIIMPMMMVSYVLMPFGAADWSLRLMGIGVDCLLQIARWTENLAGSVITTPATPQVFMIGITLAGIILILFRGREKIAAFVPVGIALLSLGLATSPDILVSGDGDVLAVHDRRQVYVSSLYKDKFAVETWGKRWNVAEADMHPFPKEGAVALAAGGHISCDPSVCRVEAGGMKLSFGTRLYELQQDCAWADIMVSPAYLPRHFCGDKPVQVFGHYNFQKNGALAIRSGKPPKMTTVADGIGERPWRQVQHKDEKEKDLHFVRQPQPTPMTSLDNNGDG